MIAAEVAIMHLFKTDHIGIICAIGDVFAASEDRKTPTHFSWIRDAHFEIVAVE